MRIGGLEALCRGLYYIGWSRDGVAKAQPECNAPTMRFPSAQTDLAIRGSRATGMADDDRKRRNEQGGPGTAVITKTKPVTREPRIARSVCAEGESHGRSIALRLRLGHAVT